ncbi:MAG: hypothetical protein K6C36_09505 [Clostridia bacterium]|nr:hypothetical protein [Clostridia bacterium]
MPKGFYDPELEPACAICAKGRIAGDGVHVLCSKKGITDPDSSCSKFRYDPIKRKPRSAPELLSFDSDEFLF